MEYVTANVRISKYLMTIHEALKQIVDAWNSVVSVEDTVYVLGGIPPLDVLVRLHGTIILLPKYGEQVPVGIQSLNQITVVGDTVMCPYQMVEWPHKNNGYTHLFGSYGKGTNAACVAWGRYKKPITLLNAINIAKGLK